MLDDADGLSRAYQQGVSMGSDLLPGAGAPSLLAWATRDPNSAPLQRLQIIKGWTVNGEHNEQVYDVDVPTAARWTQLRIVAQTTVPKWISVTAT